MHTGETDHAELVVAIIALREVHMLWKPIVNRRLPGALQLLIMSIDPIAYTVTRFSYDLIADSEKRSDRRRHSVLPRVAKMICTRSPNAGLLLGVPYRVRIFCGVGAASRRHDRWSERDYRCYCMSR